MFDRFKRFLANVTDSESATAANNLYRELRYKVDFILFPGTGFWLARWEMGKPLQQLWGKCIITIHKHVFRLYPHSRVMGEFLELDMDGLCWFNRPTITTDNSAESIEYSNTIHLHFHSSGSWYALKIQCKMDVYADNLMTAIKSTSPYYYRPTPYTPFHPAKTQIATQDLQGSWQVDKQKSKIFLASDAIVLYSKRNYVTLPFRAITEIHVLQRMDNLFGGGLIRCQVDGETWAFSMPDYEAFAMTLAERCDAPIEWMTHRKGKSDKY